MNTCVAQQILSWSHSWHAHHATHARHAHAHTHCVHLHTLLQFSKPITTSLRIKSLIHLPVGLSIHGDYSVLIQHPARHQHQLMSQAQTVKECPRPSKQSHKQARWVKTRGTKPHGTLDFGAGTYDDPATGCSQTCKGTVDNAMLDKTTKDNTGITYSTIKSSSSNVVTPS